MTVGWSVTDIVGFKRCLLTKPSIWLTCDVSDYLLA